MEGKKTEKTQKAERKMSSKQRDPNPNKNSLIKESPCCKRRVESLIYRYVLSYQALYNVLYDNDNDDNNIEYTMI